MKESRHDCEKYTESHPRKVARAMCGDTNPADMVPAKTPLPTRLKRSKFAKLVRGMSDDDIKATAYALIFSEDVAKAIKMYHTSVSNYTQIVALLYELDARDITIK